MERDRRQSNYRRQQPQRRDAVFSVMLGQITVCLILLVLAYCLKLSGLPVYNTARAALEDGLAKELDLGAVDVLLERFNMQVPVLQPETDAEQAGAGVLDEDAEQTGGTQQDEAVQGMGESADESSAGTQGETGDETEDAQAVNGITSGDGRIFDDELAGYVEQYLPKDEAAMANRSGSDNTSQSESGGKTPSPPANIPKEEPLGQGGGITPVSFSARTGDKNRWQAPAGTFFSPFYLTQQPVLPVKSGTLTSRFGYRTHPVTGKADFHTGTDIAAPSGTPIAAVLPGTVSEVGVSDFYGNYVIVRHGSNLETLYGHCSAVLVEPGTVVRAYETIAKVGSTGMSTGNHVHLEFRVQGQKGDPAWVYDEF